MFLLLDMISKSKLIIVESPTKAKTLEKYLKADANDTYKVIASYGHIRGLEGKDKGVEVNEDTLHLNWIKTKTASTVTREITKYARIADEVILATDPDREGEAVAWHVSNLIQEQGIKTKQYRIRFFEITKSAVMKAIENKEELNLNLINAYLARLSLDYLVGFKISPILWKKVPGCKSAGRVQSAALDMIIDREQEILAFVSTPYFEFTADITQNTYKAIGSLYEYNSSKVQKLTFANYNEEDIEVIVKNLESELYVVSDIEKKQEKTGPQPPFITSTLQQTACNKFSWKPAHTLRTAQKLYEGIEIDGENIGLITYIRTDHVNMSEEATRKCRDTIHNLYGKEYLSTVVRKYKSKVANAQEAHECIRPTDFTRIPSTLNLKSDEAKLYKLIWERSMASQMSDALYKIENLFFKSKSASWKVHTSKCMFLGHKRFELKIDQTSEELFNKQDPIHIKITAEKKETKPLPRYTHSTLIQKLETQGIGRPSTYVPIINTLEKRLYIKTEGNSIIPTRLGWLVIGFLRIYFKNYIDEKFTSQMEERLDELIQGKSEWKDMIIEFSHGLLQTTDKVSESRETILKNIGYLLKDYWYSGNLQCPDCEQEKKLIVLKGNIFVGCSDYPKCQYTDNYKMVLGKDGDETIILQNGIYGMYAEWTKSNKRVRVPDNTAIDELDIDRLKKLGELPKIIGIHPDTNEEISVGIGRFGPYVRYGNLYKSLTKDKDVLKVDLNDCLEVIYKKPKYNKRRSKDKVNSLRS